MDPDDPDAMAMAQAMGFSSFGSQDPPAKKRRYNPHSDASIPSVSSSNSRSNNRPSASGANSAPLGPPRESAANAHEISLDDDDDEEAEEHDSTTAPPAVGLGSLPQRPAVPTGESSLEGERSMQPKVGQGNGGRAGRGYMNPLWYENYYDSASNANPWDRLEKKFNLQPRDVWPLQSQISQQSHATSPT